MTVQTGIDGIKIERTRVLNIFSRRDTETGEKVIFGVTPSVPKNFQQENFSEPVPMESLRT